MAPQHSAETVGYLGHLYAEAHRGFAFTGSTRTDFEEWAREARPALRELVGLGRIADSLDGFGPSVTLEESVDLDGYRRHRGTLHAEPGFDVPFWYLVPDAPGPHPLALFPHGHYGDKGLDYAVGMTSSTEMAEKIRAGDRDVAVQAVRHGFACIAPSTRGFPPACILDVSKRHDGRNCRSQLMHALLAGRSVIGERVWDLERLTDWAAGRPEVDTSTVLMMGNSGGGVATLYAAACDERVTVAVASCSFCTYAGKTGLIHHCDCNVVPGVLRFGDFHDVAGLIAPRRLLLVHGRQDPLFPHGEVTRGVEGVERIFVAAGASDSLSHRWGEGGHRFYADLMWPFVLAGRVRK